MSYKANLEQLSISSNGSLVANITINTNTTLTATTYPQSEINILANASAGNVTITLPQASTVPNRKFTVKRIDGQQLTYNLIINATSSIIEDQTSVAITRIFSSLTFVSNGTQYYII